MQVVDKLPMLEESVAEGIKTLCYINIANPDTKYVPSVKTLANLSNTTFAERRELILASRKRADSYIKDLEKRSENDHSKANKAQVLDELVMVMDAVRLIDSYSIENAKKACSVGVGNPLVETVARNLIMFDTEIEGREHTVICHFYEDISMDEKKLAEFLNIDDEDTQIKFIKDNVELATRGVVPKGENDITLFANIDPVVQIEEVDK